MNLKSWVPAGPRSGAGSSQQVSQACRGLSSNTEHSCAQKSAPGQMGICSWTPSCFGSKSQALPWLLHPRVHKQGCVLSTTPGQCYIPTCTFLTPFPPWGALSPLLSEKPQTPRLCSPVTKVVPSIQLRIKITHKKTFRSPLAHHSLSIWGEEQNWFPFCLKGTHSKWISRRWKGKCLGMLWQKGSQSTAQSLLTKLLHLPRCWEAPGIQAVPKTGHLSSHTKAHSSRQLRGLSQSQGDSIKGCTAYKHEMQVARDASELLFLLCSHSAVPHSSLPWCCSSKVYTREEAQPSPATQEGQDTHSLTLNPGWYTLTRASWKPESYIDSVPSGGSVYMFSNSSTYPWYSKIAGMKFLYFLPEEKL